MILDAIIGGIVATALFAFITCVKKWAHKRLKELKP